MPEKEQEITKPVTKDVLRKAAQAGYVAEVQSSIGFASTPITLGEGVELITTALEVEAKKLEGEAEVLHGLSELSDDPRWQAKFLPRALELRSSARANRDEIGEREKAIEEWKSK